MDEWEVYMLWRRMRDKGLLPAPDGWWERFLAAWATVGRGDARAVEHILRVSREPVDWQPGERERAEQAGELVRREKWGEDDGHDS